MQTRPTNNAVANNALAEFYALYARPKVALCDATARTHYVHIARVARAYGFDKGEFKAETEAVLAAAGVKPTPVNFVKAAARVSNTCKKCGGSGVYQWGAVTNGKAAHSGECFQCEGKGHMHHHDRKRCLDYWAHSNG